MVSEEQNSGMELASEVIPVPQVQPEVQEAPEIEEGDKEDNAGSSRKPRKRNKLLYAAVRKQMEFYFGDSNLSKDRFLADCIRKDPYVDIEIFLRFNKIRNMTTDAQKIVKALRDSTMLQLSEDKTKVRRVTPIEEKTDTDDCTIYVQRLPLHADHDWLNERFSKYGPVAYVSIPKFKSTNKIKGFAFVEFDKPEDAEKCLKALRATGCELPTQMSAGDLLSIQTFEKEGENDHQVDDDNEEAKPAIENNKQSKSKKGKGSVNKSENVEDSISEDQSESSKSKKKKSVDSTEKIETDSNAEGEGKRGKKRKNHSLAGDCKKQHVEIKQVATEDTEKDTSQVKNNKKKRKHSESFEDDYKKTKVEDSSSEHENVNNENVDRTDDDSNDNTKEDEGDASEKKKKKKRKRKNTKEFATKVTPETGLQVLSKKDWKKLRNKYLNLQKQKMKQLKQHMRRAKWNQYDKYRMNFENEEAIVYNNKKSNPASNLDFVPGVIVKVELNHSCVDPKGFKAELKSANSQIKYIDIKEGSNEAFVRCDSSDTAKELLQKANEEKSFKLLTGDDEKSYWDKIRRDREEKLTNKIRCNSRGRNKLLKKAEKELGKHIKFDEI